jgi:hypothetical protein
MILTTSQTQSALYDQIKYSGEPSEFAWILPISGTVDVGLSADSLFSGLDNLTSVVVTTPPTNCPGPPASCLSDEGDLANTPTAGHAEDAGALSVTVIKTEVVGPYETVQLHPNSDTDVAALEDWLTQHNFTISDDIKPVIAEYVKEHFNFLALRLQPGKGVASMRPVRITTQGSNVALPLRMVAAGTGATVGITLWILGQGRYEPANFGSFAIKDEELAWDWASQTSNFQDLRAQKEAADPGKLWEIESVTTTFPAAIQNAARFASYQIAADGSQTNDYLPVTTNGAITKTAEQVQTDDYTTLFAGLGNLDTNATLTDIRITRIRADLAHTALTTDLTVKASDDQTDLSRTRIPNTEKGEPLCPVYQECNVTGQVPRSKALLQSANPNSADGCSSTGRSSSALTAVLAFVAIAIGRSIRQRRRDR